jgi:hypothetical protein
LFLVPVSAIAVLMVLGAAPAAAVECWRGWGYRVDPQSGAYKSEEMLLVTRGAVTWKAGRPVELHPLDRTSGRIDPDQAPITVIPVSPRTYYRGRGNYVDGRGPVQGARDDLTFGLNHIAPPAGALQAMEDYNRWACGLPPGGG